MCKLCWNNATQTKFPLAKLRMNKGMRPTVCCYNFWQLWCTHGISKWDHMRISDTSALSGCGCRSFWSCQIYWRPSLNSENRLLHLENVFNLSMYMQSLLSSGSLHKLKCHHPCFISRKRMAKLKDVLVVVWVWRVLFAKLPICRTCAGFYNALFVSRTDYLQHHILYTHPIRWCVV